MKEIRQQVIELEEIERQKRLNRTTGGVNKMKAFRQKVNAKKKKTVLIDLKEEDDPDANLDP